MENEMKERCLDRWAWHKVKVRCGGWLLLGVCGRLRGTQSERKKSRTEDLEMIVSQKIIS